MFSTKITFFIAGLLHWCITVMITVMISILRKCPLLSIAGFQLSYLRMIIIHLPPVAGQPSNDDPFVADAPVAGGTWQLPPVPAQLSDDDPLLGNSPPPLLSLEQICAAANLHAQSLHVPACGRGCGHGQGSIDLHPARSLSLDEIHTLHNQISPPPPPANCFAGLTAQQLLLVRHSLPSSGATTPAASSSASGSRAPSRIPSCQHSHAPPPISSHQSSCASLRAPTCVASPSQDDDT
jgi:hypothetical protein